MIFIIIIKLIICHNFKRVAQHYKYCCFFCSQCRQRSLLKLSSRGLSHLSETTSIVQKKFRIRTRVPSMLLLDQNATFATLIKGPCIHRSSSVRTQQDPVQTVRINLYIENCYLKDAHSFPPNGIKRQGRKRGGGGVFLICYLSGVLFLVLSRNISVRKPKTFPFSLFLSLFSSLSPHLSLSPRPYHFFVHFPSPFRRYYVILSLLLFYSW